MTKKTLTLVVSVLLLCSLNPPASAASIQGSACPSQGKSKVVAGKTFNCQKVSGRLIWTAAKSLPNCSANTIYDLRDLIKTHQELILIPAKVDEYVKELQYDYIEAIGNGDMERAMRIQFNINDASQQTQNAIGTMAKLEKTFKSITAKCFASGVSMRFVYSN